jgi:hypothetical protein
MRRHARTLALACSLACTGCPSLDALECHGASCDDAAVPGEGGVADVAASDTGGGEGGASHDRIFCGAGAATCVPPADECCLENSGGTACTSIFSCNGSDVFCDDPSQCPDGGACWICVNSGGFQGTSCDYQGDIVNNDHCNASTAKQLCHSSGQCTGGTTCQPFDVAAFDAGTGDTWFHACQ